MPVVPTVLHPAVTCSCCDNALRGSQDSSDPDHHRCRHDWHADRFCSRVHNSLPTAQHPRAFQKWEMGDTLGLASLLALAVNDCGRHAGPCHRKVFGHVDQANDWTRRWSQKVVDHRGSDGAHGNKGQGIGVNELELSQLWDGAASPGPGSLERRPKLVAF
jgi:hypothetical protein